jgi:hypothetical protein
MVWFKLGTIGTLFRVGFPAFSALMGIWAALASCAGLSRME